jgi:hypothetical protein
MNILGEKGGIFKRAVTRLDVRIIHPHDPVPPNRPNRPGSVRFSQSAGSVVGFLRSVGHQWAWRLADWRLAEIVDRCNSDSHEQVATDVSGVCDCMCNVIAISSTSMQLLGTPA